MNAPKKTDTRSNAGRHGPKHTSKRGSKNGSQKDLVKSLQAAMEKCQTAENLNAQVIMRGVMYSIYMVNIAIS